MTGACAGAAGAAACPCAGAAWPGAVWPGAAWPGAGAAWPGAGAACPGAGGVAWPAGGVVVWPCAGGADGCAGFCATALTATPSTTVSRIFFIYGSLKCREKLLGFYSLQPKQQLHSAWTACVRILL